MIRYRGSVEIQINDLRRLEAHVVHEHCGIEHSIAHVTDAHLDIERCDAVRHDVGERELVRAAIEERSRRGIAGEIGIIHRDDVSVFVLRVVRSVDVDGERVVEARVHIFGVFLGEEHKINFESLLTANWHWQCKRNRCRVASLARSAEVCALIAGGVTYARHMRRDTGAEDEKIAVAAAGKAE